MKYNYCPKRRLFLTDASKSVGLIAAANLFSLVPMTQAVTPKKNVIFIFFYHGANIPFGDNDKDFRKGGFTFGSGSNISKMSSISGDSLFVRGVNNFLTGGVGEGGHSANQAAALTGYKPRDKDSPGSIDYLIGQELQKKYKTISPYLTLGFNMHHPSGQTVKPSNDYQWKTVSYEKDKWVFPEISVDSAYKKMEQSLLCSGEGGSVSNNSGSSTDADQLASYKKELKKINLVSENLKSFKSDYLISKEEMEKLEAQVAKKIELLNQKINGRDLAGNTDGVKGCDGLVNPKNSYSFKDDIKPDKNLNLDKESYENFNTKSTAFFDLMIMALKNNYTRSITYHTNTYDILHHDKGGHDSIGNPYIVRYLDELAATLNQLFVKLKKANLYDETMVVVTGEFAQQNKLNSSSPFHRADNIPWLVVNSGKSGEVNYNSPLHSGDVHCNIFNRMGIAKKESGGVHSQLNRVGNYNKVFL